MRILVDTNILLSAMWFKDSKVAKALLHVANNHELILCDQSISAMRDVIKRKTPKALSDGYDIGEVIIVLSEQEKYQMTGSERNERYE